MLMTCDKTRCNHVWGGPLKQPRLPHSFASVNQNSGESRSLLTGNTVANVSRGKQCSTFMTFSALLRAYSLAVM